MKNFLIGVLVVAVVVFGYLAFKPKAVIVPSGKTITADSTLTKPKTVTHISTTLPIYIGGQKGWPPVIQHVNTPYSCTLEHSQNSDTVERVINGKTYCIKIDNEGAAGTIYYTYTYTTPSTNTSGVETTNFILAFHDVDCETFGSAENISCHANQPSFNVNEVIASLM